MSQHQHVVREYAPRARDYVSSLNHATGEDLDQAEALVRGRGGAVVLDLGCGGGHVSYRAAPHVASVIAYDLTQEMLDEVASEAATRFLPNISTIKGPAEKMPFPTAQFDAVLCRFTAHHWQNFEAGLREARRVLKPTGFALFIDTTAPADPVLDTHMQAVEVLRDASHVRNYTIAEWIAALTRSGFVTETLTNRKLRMNFPVWIARTRTPEAHAIAIKSLQSSAPDIVRSHFQITPDGSFTIDTAAIHARPDGVNLLIASKTARDAA